MSNKKDIYVIKNDYIKKKKSIVASGGQLIIKIVISVGVVYAFYKVPGIISDKISYKQLVNKK